MQNPAGYRNPVKIYESGNSQIFRAYDEANERAVIIKRLNKVYPAPEEISAFHREYEITGMFNDEGVIEVYSLTKFNNSPAFVMEDIMGRSLADIIKTRKLSVTDFLKLSITVAEIIGNIHRRNIIHKDINPSNIIWNTETDTLRIIDFGIATEHTREITSVKNPNVLEGTLSYISPEQTGRMNRSLDYRTDFYSLGVTFYLLLTGHLPFESKDLLKLVHSHIAVKPVTPHEIDESIPEILSMIVMKLLEKNAEDRYQSAHGIREDLVKCRDEFNNTGSIISFKPGQSDLSDRFQIPQKLYGREAEIDQLMSAFERVSAGSTEIMLVSGFSGIGKSVLINEIQKPIVKHRGYFISGKYEKLKRDVPYSGIIQAFTGLARQILAEDKTVIERWKDEFLKVLGPNGRIITDIIPLFELIIGRQPDVPTLGPVESQNRFKLVFLEFIKVFGLKEHPIAVFLDDLQWADQASLYLLKLFTTDPELKYFFMIGSYRNDEASGSHPLILTIDEIAKSGAVVNEIVLQPLNTQHARRLLEDTLNRCEEDVSGIADIIIRKTGGNPFFINEFLNYLYKKNLIEFSFKKGWFWDLNGIEDLQVTDNVVDLMVSKISAFSGSVQEILMLGACMGSYFNMSSLSAVSGKTEDCIIPFLNEALNEGILNRNDDVYRFSHDRILEAAYSMIPEDERKRQHHRIGVLELINTDKEKLHDKIFYIVNHLNAGSELISNDLQIYELAGLNHIAGRKALASNAYDSALNYFRSGIALLGEDCWEKKYELTLALYQDAAISAQLCADYEVMEKFTEEVINNAITVLDKIKVYETEIFACIARNQLNEGIRAGLKVLGQLGLKLPEKPGRFRIIYELLSLKLFLAGKRVEDLVDLPEMKDPHKLAIMQILTGLATSAYYAAPDFLPLVIFNTVRLSVKYGNSIYSPYAYAGFGMTHCGVLGDIKTGFKWGKLALDLIDKFNIIETRSRVWMVVRFFIYHWKRPLRESIKPLIESYKSGLETGELEFAALSAATYVINQFSSGKKLDKVDKEMAEYTDVISRYNQDTILTYVRMHHQNVLNLRGFSDNPCVFSGTAYDQSIMLPAHKAANDISALFYYYFYSLTLNYVFENSEEALKNAESVKPYSDAQISNPYLPVINFYDSLIRLDLISPKKKSDSKSVLKTVLKNQKKMKKWASHAPANYSHKYHLVEAEIARVEKQEFKAREHYTLAIKLSHENRFLHEEALSCKLYAKFWLGLKEEKIATLYMSEAIHLYRIWGADAAVKYNEEKYKSLLLLNEEALKVHSGAASADTSTSSTSRSIDLATVIKTSQTISSEIDLGRLLEATIKFAIENAGAERGFLIMENEDDKNLYIEAEGEPDERIRVACSIPLENNPGLSATIVNYVNRTGENVVLDNACKEGIFTNDPYIMNNKIKSLLCLPVKYKGKTSGILYLENNLAENAFTSDRLGVLRVLSSQAAISVENARLLIHRENKAKLEKEIEMAEKIQRSLLPADLPEIENVRVAYKYIPMMGVGGDFVNIFHRKDEDKIGLFICDVSGHGVYAAMIASMVSNSLDFFWEKHFETPSMILKEMSHFLQGKMGGYFFTGCLCSIDLKSGTVTMSNAGHPPLMLIKKNGSIELKGTKGRLISEFFEPNHEDNAFILENGDTIVLYTDGITEAENPEREIIGSDNRRFCDWVNSFVKNSSSPYELCENIYRGVLEHTATDQLEDDFTILVFEYKV